MSTLPAQRVILAVRGPVGVVDLYQNQILKKVIAFPRVLVPWGQNDETQKITVQRKTA